MDLPGIGLLIKIVSFVVSSWLLVHLLAIFGVFLALAYPLWWFIYPRKTPCLFCRTRKEGDQCPFCQRQITKKEEVNVVSFRSAVLNGLLVLAFSLVSFGIVFLESKVLFKLGFPPTPKTVTFTIPTKGQYRLGEIFPMKIEIAGIKTPINSVQADLGFDPQRLEAVEISTENSFAKIFVQKEVNNEVGYARLTGGLPNPGFFAEHGVFGTVFLRGKNPGVTKVEFLPSSMALANDGRGTNVLKDLASASYLILPEEISETEKKQQEALIRPVVLGEKVEETQMKFYEEKDILGARVGQEVEKEQKFNLGENALHLLEELDRWTLSFWDKILP